MAEALYRKYRPQTFEDVVGQDHIERTLRNAIQTDKVSHAYLFTGPRGTGKTTTARLLAKALLCEKGPTPDPDGTCEDCELIAAGEHPDVYELDAASRTGVENVREEIIGRVNYAPTRGRYKVYIIDEVHMLSVAAFNALLKTLEEPPAHVVFVLCTTDPQKVPETIQSRCQRFDFKRNASEELISRVGAICEMEGVEYEGDALDLIAHRAQGGMRDALTSLEQLITFSNGSVSALEAERLLGALDSSDLADIVRAIGTRDAAACFRWTSEYVETGADLAQIAKDLAEHVRDMYVMSLAGADVALEITEAARREMESELAWFGSDRLSRLLAVLGDLISELKTSTNQRLSFEIALTRMIRPQSDITLSSLAERVEALERAGVVGGAIAGGALPATAAGVGTPLASNASSADVSHDAHVGKDSQGAQEVSQSGQSAPAAESSASAGSALPSESAAVFAAATDAADSLGDPSVSVGGSAGGDNTLTGGGVAPASDIPSSSSPVADNTSAPSSGQTATLSGLDVNQVWGSILSNLKKQSEAYGVLFMNTFASSQNDGAKLLVEFPSGNNFAFNAAKKPEVRAAFEKALASVGLSGLAYDIAQSDKVASVPTQAAPVQAASQGASFAPGAQTSNAQIPQAQQARQTESQGVSSQSTSTSRGDYYDDYDASGFAPDDYLPSEAYEDMPVSPATANSPSSHASVSGADGSGVASAQQAQSAQPAQTTQPAQAGQVSQTDPGAVSSTSDVDAASAATMDITAEPTLDEISDNLSSMFGEGVVFEEVD